MRFHDRVDAGRRLAGRLAQYADRRDVIVLALPRGGVPVGAEVARALDAPLDVFLVRKIGVPGHPELAMGAIAAGGVRVLSEDLISELRIPRALVEERAARERLELERREQAYRRGRPLPPLAGLAAILVDDGLATGSTMEAAVSALRAHRAARVVVAAPVGSVEACHRVSRSADEVVCLSTPASFSAVGQWYEDFGQVPDEAVIDLLARVHPPRNPGGAGTGKDAREASGRPGLDGDADAPVGEDDRRITSERRRAP